MKKSSVLVFACTCLWLTVSASGGTVVLKRAWMDQYKNRATIDVQVNIDRIKPQPNPISKGAQDGDLHMASRSDAVGLPFVSEIVNAAEESDAAKIARQAQSAGSAVEIAGAWRLWFEHPDKNPQIQGHPVAVAQNTNPAHVFEIHPISVMGSKDIRDSFHPIEKAASPPGTPTEYEAYDAATAFVHYEALNLTVQRSGTGVTLTAPKVGYNYSEFFARLGQRLEVADGTLVLAEIEDGEGNSVAASPVRLVFVKGTPAQLAVEQAVSGATLHLLGIPRVNLERVSNLVSSLAPGQQVTVKLPYEMIVVGAYTGHEGAPAGARETTLRPRSRLARPQRHHPVQ